MLFAESVKPKNRFFPSSKIKVASRSGDHLVDENVGNVKRGNVSKLVVTDEHIAQALAFRKISGATRFETHFRLSSSRRGWTRKLRGSPLQHASFNTTMNGPRQASNSRNGESKNNLRI